MKKVQLIKDLRTEQQKNKIFYLLHDLEPHPKFEAPFWWDKEYLKTLTTATEEYISEKVICQRSFFFILVLFYFRLMRV